jgi:hypothetical protein
VTKFNISIDLKPLNKDGRLHLELRDAVIEVEDYNVELKG